MLATGTAEELLTRTGTSNLDQAFIALLPKSDRGDDATLIIPPRDTNQTVNDTRKLTGEQVFAQFASGQ